MQDSLHMSEKLQGLGQADGMQLADARQALAESDLDREQARLAQGLAYVALYKALGGAPLPAEDAACAAGPGQGGESTKREASGDCAP
jgi:outer membrane protein TolC